MQVRNQRKGGRCPASIVPVSSANRNEARQGDDDEAGCAVTTVIHGRSACARGVPDMYGDGPIATTVWQYSTMRSPLHAE